MTLALSLLIFSSSFPAHAFSADAKRPPTLEEIDAEEPADGVYTAQSFKFQGPEGKDGTLDWIVVQGENIPEVLEGFRLATKQNFRQNDPLKEGKILAVFDHASDAAVLHEQLDLTSLPAEDRRIFTVDETSSKATKSARIEGRRTSRSIANTGPTTRKDILVKLHQLKRSQASFAENEARWATLGDQITRARFDRSARKLTLVGMRTSIGAVGMGWSMVMANAHPEMILGMTAAGGSMSLGTQYALDWLAHQYTYAQPYEKAVVNAFLRYVEYPVRKVLKGKNAGPLLEWVPPPRTQSGVAASMTKWAATEQLLNSANRLAALALFSLNDDAQIVVNGERVVPDDYRFAKAMTDTFAVTGETVATQGIYEGIFNGEFARRTDPYNILVGYHLENLARRFDPSLLENGGVDAILKQKGGAKALTQRLGSLLEKAGGEADTRLIKEMVETAIKLNLRERTVRGLLANLGSLSWIMNLGLKTHSPVLGTISAFSLLPVSAGLKMYYGYRLKVETRLLRKELADYSDQVAEAAAKKSIAQAVGSYCAGFLKDIRQWRDQFKSELRPVPAKGAR